MSRPGINDIVAFVPARDFEKSRNFYLDLGFEQMWGDAAACGLRMDGQTIILQNFHVKEHTENFMMQMVVDDANAWWERIQALGLREKYSLGTLKPPQMQPWGLVVLFITDPSGVLWHIAEVRRVPGGA
jgi:uncharacterized glyoxalase superfamily protein PhnB